MPRTVAVCIGTRPEAIKLMPVLHALARADISYRVLLTGQHAELLEPILQELGIRVDENLRLMQADQSLSGLSARVLEAFEALLRRERPELLLVQGDTTSAAMSALAAFYRGVPVAHVEAGLRTHDLRNPFPEELNRRLIGCLASHHFAPTDRARENLLREGVTEQSIHVVGNTVIDAVLHARDVLLPRISGGLEPRLAPDRPLLLVTSHRRESIGPDLEAICEGIRRVADRFGDGVQVVFPVHRNPHVRAEIQRRLASRANVRLLEPLSYLRFVRLLLSARLVVTDSGGVQEEAAFLGIPVLVVRRTTERPEGIEAGCAELVGCDAQAVFRAASLLLTDEAAHRGRAVPTLAYGDGKASERIVASLLRSLP